MKFNMDALLHRKDDSTNLVSTDMSGDTFISLEDIVHGYSDQVKVFMIRPGGVLPACQPKNIKN